MEINETLNILVVDDDTTTRASLKKYLSLTYKNVDCAGNGHEALEKFEASLILQTPINLIVADINMPEMDGIELVSNLRHKGHDVAVIFVTARTDTNYLVDAVELNVNNYLIKPVMLNKLLDKVNLISQDIDLKKSLKTKTKKIENYVKLIDEHLISISIELDGRISYVSTALLNITGYEIHELLGIDFFTFISNQNSKELVSKINECLLNNENFHDEIKINSKHNNIIWLDSKITSVIDDDFNEIGYTMISQDITDKKLIEEISITDGLTGIYNRRHFNELFPKIIRSSKRHNDLVSLIILDIDYFKQYNDNYGHQMGDSVLTKVSKCIKDSLKRADDFCFRLGGEEFGIIFKSDEKDKAVEFANIIKDNIESLEIEHIKSDVSAYITVSIGLASKYAIDIEFNDFFYKEADDLLYKAKKQGRNLVVSN